MEKIALLNLSAGCLLVALVGLLIYLRNIKPRLNRLQCLENQEVSREVTAEKFRLEAEKLRGETEEARIRTVRAKADAEAQGESVYIHKVNAERMRAESSRVSVEAEGAELEKIKAQTVAERERAELLRVRKINVEAEAELREIQIQAGIDPDATPPSPPMPPLSKGKKAVLWLGMTFVILALLALFVFSLLKEFNIIR